MAWAVEQEASASAPSGGPDELSFRFFYDKSPLLMGTIALCPDGDVLHIYDNPATSRFFGTAPGATHGRRARDLGVPEEILGLWRAHYLLSATRADGVRFEYPHPAGSGERRLAVTVASLGVETSSGFPLFSYVAEDVTERRAIELRLRESEARLKLALEAGRMAVFDWPLCDPQPPLTPEVRAQLRIAPGASSTVEARRRTYHPDDLALARATRERALSGRERFIDFEFRYFWPDGEMRWLQVRSEVIHGPDGAPERLVGVQLDVTEQRRAQEAVRASEQRLRTLASTIPALVFETDAAGLNTYVNDRLIAYAGLPEGELLGEGWLQLVHPDDLARAVAAMRRAWAGEDGFDEQYRLRRADGAYRWHSVRAAPCRSADGRIGSWFGVCLDTDDQKVAEARLAASEQRLRLMMHELNHRVKNNLATIASLAGQTAKSCVDMPDFLAKFVGRLQALSKSNELLTRTSWGEVELEEVLESALRPFAGDALSMQGPEGLNVNARVAVGLSLVLHELSTNAIKYGAFSADGGRLDIAWRSLDETRAEIVWTECAARPVAAPAASGFGTTLIGRVAAGDLGGDAELSFEPGGLVAKIRFRRGAAEDDQTPA